MSTKTLGRNPSPGSRSHLTIVNAAPANVGTGTAVMSLIVAEATRRPHLAEAITSIQFDVKRGIGVLVTDAGARQHLANALGFDSEVAEFVCRPHGSGFARTGHMAGLEVVIWNLEP